MGVFGWKRRSGGLFEHLAISVVGVLPLGGMDIPSLLKAFFNCSRLACRE